MKIREVYCKSCNIKLDITLHFPETVSDEKCNELSSNYRCIPCMNKQSKVIDPNESNRNEAYKRFLELCQSLGFESKVGFNELQDALTDLFDTDQLTSIRLSLELLAIEREYTYYGGSWDGCPNSLEDMQ